MVLEDFHPHVSYNLYNNINTQKRNNKYSIDGLHSYNYLVLLTIQTILLTSISVSGEMLVSITVKKLFLV